MSIDMECVAPTGFATDYVQIVLPRSLKYMKVGTLSAQEQLLTLDFTISRIILTHLTASIDECNALADSNFLEDELAMRLVIRHIVCPITSVKRLMKYAKKGYTCPTVDIIKLFVEWSERALTAPTESDLSHPTCVVQGATMLETKRLNDSDLIFEIEGLERILYAMYMD